MMALLGEVERRRVLEVGCGAGPLTAWLGDRGATVTAMDVSPAMVQLAKERVPEVTFLVADLAEPRFSQRTRPATRRDSLVLHHVKSWEEPLRELRRVLKPDGAVLFSTHHPPMDWPLLSPDDYFAFKQVTETWSKGSREFEVTFWRRPLTAMTEAIASAGFLIERLTEPEPRAELRDRDREAYGLLRTRPQFLFFRLRPG